MRCPPGDEIFSTTQSMPEKGVKERDQSEGATSASKMKGDHTLAMFEVDGRKAKVYCQVGGPTETESDSLHALAKP